MDNIKNASATSSKFAKYKKQTDQIKYKLIPVYIVKKDTNNSSILGSRKFNFQANYGHTYRLSYKYFAPKGYHLAKDSKSQYIITYNKNGLTVDSVIFVYDRNGVSNNGTSRQSIYRPKPIQVNYVDGDNNRRVQTGLARGNYGQSVNVLNQVSMPAGYILCHNQKTIYQIKGHRQSVNLKIRRKSLINRSVVRPARAQVNSSKSQPEGQLQRNIQENVENLKRSLHEYDCNITVQLIHEVLHHDLNFFKTVITVIFSKMKYRGINNLRLNRAEHKISGVIKKDLYNNNHVNFTFVRAVHSNLDHRITIDEVRDFVTSVADHNSSKGIFITTSHFTVNAQKEAERHSLILIDATRLAHLMLQYDVGVQSKRIFRIVKLDKNFFY